MTGAGLTLLVIMAALAFLSPQVQANEREAIITQPNAVGNRELSTSNSLGNQAAEKKNHAPMLQEADRNPTTEVTSQEGVDYSGTINNPQTNMHIIVETVKDVAQKREETLLGIPGWIHIVSQPYQSQENRQAGEGFYSVQTDEFVPREELFPEQAYFDSWYHVDSAGNFYEAMTLTATDENTIHQKSILAGDRWINLTLKAKNFDSKAYETANESRKLILPTVRTANLLDEMATWKNVSMQAYRENELYVVIASQMFEEPFEDATLKEPVLGGKETFVFEIQTGQKISSEVHLLLQDGSWIFRERWEFSLVEYLPQLPLKTAELFNDSMRALEEEK